jgi:hypothetical protein
MTTLANYQSIFQLGAGLAIGFSGILSLFPDPLDKELRKLTFLGKRTRALSVRYKKISDTTKKRIDDLDSNIDHQIDILQKNLGDYSNFYAVRIFSILLSFVSAYVLISSSEYPSEPLNDFHRMIGWISLLFVPVSSILIFLHLRSIRIKYGNQRALFDDEYVTCVDDCSLALAET